jgi:hypothetical protein
MNILGLVQIFPGIHNTEKYVIEISSNIRKGNGTRYGKADALSDA